MMDLKTQKEIREKAVEYFKKAGICLSEDELANKIKIFDYNIGDFYKIGVVIVTFINTERYCGKFILFFPGQCCVEHWHPEIEEYAAKGKEETLRIIYGQAYAYGEGEPTKNIKAKIPEGKEKYFTSRREVILNPGDQYTVGPCERHWWQAGPEGALALEVSSTSRDDYDLYTVKNLKVDVY